LKALICFWAFSGLSQKVGSDWVALNFSRSLRFLAMSKRVSEEGQAVDHVVDQVLRFRKQHHRPVSKQVLV